MLLTDPQWLAIKSLIPEKERQPPGKHGGRPWASAREVLDGVLWVLRTGAPWADLPRRFPSYQTCHRRFQHWVETGVLPRILAALRKDLEQRGGIEDVEGFIDGTYVPAKKGGLRREVPGREGHETHGGGKQRWSSTRCPYCGRNRFDSVLTEGTLDAAFVAQLPPRLIADKAWDGGILQRRLWDERGIDLITPRKKNSRRHQDGRKLRRYKRRWKVERLFA